MNLESNPILRLRVSQRAESILRSGHPWLFSDSIREQNRTGQTGDLAVIYDRKDQFLGIGLFDPEGPIRVRMLHVGKPQKLDRVWWQQHLTATLDRRRNLFDSQTNGYRLCNGESDGWPGLVLDRYDSTLVLKIYTTAWIPRLEEIVEIIGERVPCERIILRLSRNIQDKSLPFTEGQIVLGKPLLDPVIFLESGIRFEVDVVHGQKTGFFLDQRENRRLVESLSHGRRVLNAFSFSGGFSLYAARGGAVSVTDLDISPHALAAANRNFDLNLHDPAIGRRHHEIVKADAFDWLDSARPASFDLIVLDPPSLAKREIGTRTSHRRLWEIDAKRPEPFAARWHLGSLLLLSPRFDRRVLGISPGSRRPIRPPLQGTSNHRPSRRPPGHFPRGALSQGDLPGLLTYAADLGIISEPTARMTLTTR